MNAREQGKNNEHHIVVKVEIDMKTYRIFNLIDNACIRCSYLVLQNNEVDFIIYFLDDELLAFGR